MAGFVNSVMRMTQVTSASFGLAIDMHLWHYMFYIMNTRRVCFLFRSLRSIMQMLREKKTLLTEILSADSSYILQNVQQEEIVTNRDYNNLNIPNQSNEKTVINLLDKVMNKGDTKSYELVNLLQKPHMIKNYPRLEEIFNNHTEPSDHTFNPAPTIPIPCTGTTHTDY